MPLLVKICGLSTRETLDTALEAGADMVGFVFFPPSPRHLSLETARELGRQAKGRAAKVALTVMIALASLLHSRPSNTWTSIVFTVPAGRVVLNTTCWIAAS